MRTFGELQGRSPLGRRHLLCHRCGNRVGRPRGFPDRSRAVATRGRSLTPPIFGRGAVGAACWGSGSVEPASSPRRLGRFGCLAQIRARRRARVWWPPLSVVSSPGGTGEAAALVLATQEFVANGGGRSSLRRRRSAESPGRTGSRGRDGRCGWSRSIAELAEPSVHAAPGFSFWAKAIAGRGAGRVRPGRPLCRQGSRQLGGAAKAKAVVGRRDHGRLPLGGSGRRPVRGIC
jgi:hypothetical protein